MKTDFTTRTLVDEDARREARELLRRLLHLAGELDSAQALADRILCESVELFDTSELGALRTLSLTLDSARKGALDPLIRRLDELNSQASQARTLRVLQVYRDFTRTLYKGETR